jgi:hypothetical protein
MFASETGKVKNDCTLFLRDTVLLNFDLLFTAVQRCQEYHDSAICLGHILGHPNNQMLHCSWSDAILFI